MILVHLKNILRLFTVNNLRNNGLWLLLFFLSDLNIFLSDSGFSSRVSLVLVNSGNRSQLWFNRQLTLIWCNRSRGSFLFFWLWCFFLILLRFWLLYFLYRFIVFRGFFWLGFLLFDVLLSSKGTLSFCFFLFFHLFSFFFVAFLLSSHI